MAECFHRNFELFMSKWYTILVIPLKLIKKNWTHFYLNAQGLYLKDLSIWFQQLLQVKTGEVRHSSGLIFALRCLYTSTPRRCSIVWMLEMFFFPHSIFSLVGSSYPCSQLNRAERTCLLPISCLKIPWQFFGYVQSSVMGGDSHFSFFPWRCLRN